MRRVSRIILALILVSVAALVLVLWGPMRQWMNLRALRKVMPGAAVSCSGPETTRIYSGLWKGRWEEWLVDKMGHETYALFVGGPVEVVSISKAYVLHGEVGDVLTRFPKLRGFNIVMDRSAVPSEDEWTRLCHGLRSCRRLQALNIVNGEGLTDAAFAPLAGHPTLDNVTVIYHRLTPAFLATVPHLKRLVFAIGSQAKGRELTGAQWTEFCGNLRAMPHLEDVLLAGNAITDAAVAPLAGHPSLRRFQVTSEHLSDRCVPTFATMPSLTSLALNRGWNGTPSAPADVRNTITAALPKVKVTFSP